MFGITGKLGGTDWRNSGATVAPSVNSNIVIFTNNNTDLNSSWLTITQGKSRLIKARNEDFADVGIPSNGTSASFALSTGTNGSHDSANYGAYANPYEYPNYGFGGSIRGTSGSHTHGNVTINITSNNFPPYRIAYMRKRNPNSSPFFQLPIGTIIFGENLDNVSGVSGYSSYSNRYLMGGEGVSTGGSSNPISVSILTNSAGDHQHTLLSGYGAINGLLNQNDSGVQNKAFQDQDMVTSHQHYVTASFNIKNKYVKLRTYVTNNSNVVISRGMIFGFVSAVNDPDWVCCNGQTAKGYTTPNLVDRFIMCGDSTLASHNVKPSSVDDDNTVTYISSSMDTNSWSHSHGFTKWPGITSFSAVVLARYHGTASISHSHTVFNPTAINSSYTFEPTHFNLIFYIYLP